MPTPLTHDEKLQMVDNMKHYGGHFVQALAECFLYADEYNLARLYAAFPEYVSEYRPKGLSKFGHSEDIAE